MIDIEKVASDATRILGYISIAIASICFIMMFFKGIAYLAYSFLFLFLSQILIVTANDMIAPVKEEE